MGLISVSAVGCRDLVEPGQQLAAQAQTAELTIRDPDGVASAIGGLRLYRDFGAAGAVHVSTPGLRAGEAPLATQFLVERPGRYVVWVHSADDRWPTFSVRDISLPATVEIQAPYESHGGNLDLGAALPLDQLQDWQLWVIRRPRFPDGTFPSAHDWILDQLPPPAEYRLWLVPDVYAVDIEFRLESARYELRIQNAFEFPAQSLEAVDLTFHAIDLQFELAGAVPIGQQYSLELQESIPDPVLSRCTIDQDAFDGLPRRLWSTAGLRWIEVRSREELFLPVQIPVELPQTTSMVVDLGRHLVQLTCVDLAGATIPDLRLSVRGTAGEIHLSTDQLGSVRFFSGTGRLALEIAGRSYADLYIDADADLRIEVSR